MNEIIVITGQRGKGKTTLVKEYIEKFDRVVIFDSMGEFTYYETAKNINEFFQLLSARKKDDFFILNYYNPKSSDSDFEIVCKGINRCSDLVFVVDEIDLYSSSAYIPKDLAEIIKRGRHQNLNLICATRRPHEIPRLITSQVSQFITFRHLEPRDLDYIKSLTEVSEERVKNLKDFYYLNWNNGEVKEGYVKKPQEKPSTIIDEDLKEEAEEFDFTSF